MENDSVKGSRKTITVLIPCCNEQEALPILFDRMDALVASDDPRFGYLLLFVDDGSKDGTRSLIRQYAAEHDYVEYIFLGLSLFGVGGSVRW